MTTPNQPIPDTLETLLGFGAFQIGGGVFRYGQTLTEDITRTLITGAGTALLGAFTTVEGFIENLVAYLSTLPLEALQWMRQFIPGSILSDFDTISSAVATIIAALHLDNVAMRLSDFLNWINDTYTILETEVHQVIDAFLGDVVTPITSRVAGFLDWLDGLTHFRSETAGTLTTLLGYFAALISGVGGTLISDVASAIVEGVTALARLTTLITGLGGTAITDVVDLIAGAVADVATSLAHWVTLITGLGGSTVSDVVSAIGSGVTALSRIVSLITGTGGTTIGDVVTSINDAYSHALSAFTDLGSLITGLGGTTVADLITFLSNASTKAISAFNAIAALISGVSGAVIGDVVGTINTAATGAADALAKLASLIASVGGTVIGDVETVITDTQTGLADLQTGIVSTLGGIGSDVAAVEAALAAIPVGKVVGQFTSTLSADLNGFGAAVAAFFGIGGTPTMPAILAAAAPTAAQLDSATNIANAVEAYLTTQVISNPPNVAMADGSFPSFNHELLAGSSLPTINVTQDASAAATIVLPATGTQGVPIASVAWLGGVLSGITSIVINIYQWNIANALAYPTNTNNLPFPSHTANIPVLLFSSPNQVSTTDTVLGYSFYDFPAAGSSPPPAATAGMSPSVFTAPLGTKYLVEMLTFGAGTYPVAGIQHQAPARGNAVPQYMGATRVPLAFDANTAITQSSSTTGVGSATESVTISAKATCAVLSVTRVWSGSTPAFNAKIGTTAMTLVTSNAFTGSGLNAALDTYILFNPPTGAQTVTLGQTVSGAVWNVSMACDSYIGPTGVGTVQSSSGSSSASGSLTCTTGAPGGITVVGMGCVGTTSFTPSGAANSRYSDSGVGGVPGLSVGDISGSASSTFGIVGSGGAISGWAITALPLTVSVAPATIAALNPAGGTAPAYSTNVPFFELCGSAGVSQHAPVTTTYTTAGTYTYPIPSVNNGGWMVAGDKIDVVIAPAGGGGEWASSGNIGSFGDVGSWGTKTLVLGTDVPMTTASLSITVGAGGATSYPTVGNGSAGGTGSIGAVSGGYTGLTVTGGAGGSGGGTSGIDGALPDEPFNAVTYFGGGEGESPGGGGGAGYNNVVVSGPHGSRTINLASTAGADGAAFLTAYNG